MEDGFSNKEVLAEIKKDLKDFRVKYDIDQKERASDLSKRPTRTELWALIASAGVLVGLTLRI